MICLMCGKFYHPFFSLHFCLVCIYDNVIMPHGAHGIWQMVHTLRARAWQVCAPHNSQEVVRELSKHPQVLADVLSLSAASEGARKAAASETPFKGAGKVPCIEELLGAAACFVPAESYQASNGLLSLP